MLLIIWCITSLWFLMWLPRRGQTLIQSSVCLRTAAVEGFWSTLWTERSPHRTGLRSVGSWWPTCPLLRLKHAHVLTVCSRRVCILYAALSFKWTLFPWHRKQLVSCRTRYTAHTFPQVSLFYFLFCFIFHRTAHAGSRLNTRDRKLLNSH